MPDMPKTSSKQWSTDKRPQLPDIADEREMMTAYLDWNRATFESKCAGLEPGRLSEQSVPPSTMSLHGLIRPPRSK